MNTKFEPGQLVLMKIGDCHKWTLRHFSHMIDFKNPYAGMDGGAYRYCIPFSEETKHLQNTSLPYEPPVDEATRFECGERVEVFCGEDGWTEAIYLRHRSAGSNSCNQHRVYDIGSDRLCTQPPNEIRKVKP